MKEHSFVNLILFHIIIGVLLAFFPFCGKIYAILIIIMGLYFVIKNKNKNNEVLYIAAYISGCEVFLRIIKAAFIYQYSGVFVLFFIFLGFLYKNELLKKNPYWLLLRFTIPGVLLSIQTLNYNVKNTIVFNISGIVVLAVCSLYTYKQKIGFKQINSVLLAVVLPIITSCVYLLINYSSIIIMS